ncbi:MAG TPA: ABC transporter substrate-binding protein [Mycobacteriales bacterium]|nr:ABC transporter substrate-binding protein [Mycobacteriales bacterium]
MLSARDRLLAALFAFQLVVAAVLGGYLVHALSRDDRAVLAQVPQGGPVPTTSAGGNPLATTPAGSQGTAGHSVTTTNGGSGPGTVGQGSADKAVVPPGAPIKIGAVVSQTGPINFVSSAQATKAYFDRLNRQGGINGHKIILDLRDDQLDATRGQQLAQQLVNEGVFAFVGWNAPNTESQNFASFLAQNKMPLIGAYGQQNEYHSPYAYAFSATYGHFGYEMARYVAEHGAKHPGLVYLRNGNDKADQALEQAFKDGYKSKGVTLQDNDIHPVEVTQVSYDDVVTSFRLGRVDGFASLLDQTAYNRLLQSQDRQAYHVTHVADPLFVDPSVQQSARTDGVFVTADYDFIEGGGAAVKDYVSTVRSAFGSNAQINYFGEQGWLDAVVFAEAVKAMGTAITRANLLAVMDKLSGKGGYGLTSDLHFGRGVRDLNRCVKFGKMVSGHLQRVTGWRCNEQPF